MYKAGVSYVKACGGKAMKAVSSMKAEAAQSTEDYHLEEGL